MIYNYITMRYPTSMSATICTRSKPRPARYPWIHIAKNPAPACEMYIICMRTR